MLRRPDIRIGIDIMGSDSSPELLLQAAATLAESLPANIKLVAIGHPRLQTSSPLSFQTASETIEMDDPPLLAIRRKKDSSLCVGLKMLREKELDAFVSAGNTGALVSYAKMSISMLPGLMRPALLALLPTKKEPIAVLDVGANLQCKAGHLIQFAQIGAAYQLARGIERPTVGLLNIGSEALKGTSELQTAYHQLSELSKEPHAFFSFAGNIEGKNVFDGNVDVLVTDGFTGNVFLKTAEGLANLILDRINENVLGEQALNMRGHLQDLQHHLHYAEYPGALLCGVKGIVIKCHGYSSPEAFTSGIREAIRLASEGFIQTLQDKLVKRKP